MTCACPEIPTCELRRSEASSAPVGSDDGQSESCSGPEVGFEEISVDLLQARFWIVSADQPEIVPSRPASQSWSRRRRADALHYTQQFWVQNRSDPSSVC